MQFGHHGIELKVPRRGIHILLQDIVDGQLRAGILPKKLFNNLQLRYKRDEMLRVVPTVAQITNRKKSIFKDKSKLDTVSSINDYIKERMVKYIMSYLYMFDVVNI
jgi:hypothetical protein